MSANAIEADSHPRRRVAGVLEYSIIYILPEVFLSVDVAAIHKSPAPRPRTSSKMKQK
jgi:hypothetical protein